MNFFSKPKIPNDKIEGKRRLLEAIEKAGSDASIAGVSMRDIGDMLDDAGTRWRMRWATTTAAY